MQTLIVILIVAASVLFTARRLWRTAKGKDGCGCGCSDCPHRCQCQREDHE